MAHFGGMDFLFSFHVLILNAQYPLSFVLKTSQKLNTFRQVLFVDFNLEVSGPKILRMKFSWRLSNVNKSDQENFVLILSRRIMWWKIKNTSLQGLQEYLSNCFKNFMYTCLKIQASNLMLFLNDFLKGSFFQFYQNYRSNHSQNLLSTLPKMCSI